IRVANGACHVLLAPQKTENVSNVCLIYAVGHGWATSNTNATFFAISISYLVPHWTTLDPLAALSRRQHRFESGRGRQSFQDVMKLGTHQCPNSVPNRLGNWTGPLTSASWR